MATEDGVYNAIRAIHKGCYVKKNYTKIIKLFDDYRSLYTLQQTAAPVNTSRIITVFGRTVNKKFLVNVARTLLRAS
jgi:hypothetical protein